MKKLLRVIFGRTTMTIILMLAQIGVVVYAYNVMKYDVNSILGVLDVVALLMVVYIINRKNDNPSFKLAWLLLIIVFKLFGALMYIFVRLQLSTKIMAVRIGNLIEKTRGLLKQNHHVIEKLEKESRNITNFAQYMYGIAGGFPVYNNSTVKYFPLGEDKFEEMIKQLEKAEKFIFLEYFIIEEGIMWNTILEILKRKVQEGVEVRLMYDGTCSIAHLPYNYTKRMEKLGIKCKMFNPIKPILSTHQNNRDHRKILVIDGKVGFTGGVNLSDEYINKRVVYGHWKDNAIMVKGEAVKSFTAMFLQMWNVSEINDEEFDRYIDLDYSEFEGIKDGYIIPYGDSPMDGENVGEQVYIDILYHAHKYVHIMTPYLIIDNEMLMALKYASKRGVDVKIIMPHIPDKEYAYAVARTYYAELIEAGVEIYEYTPGFVHAKTFVSDDDTAVVGTINLDFRSLYLHFECATYMFKNSEIINIEKDYQATLEKCQKIDIENCRKQNILRKVTGRVLRLIAPLM